MPEGTVKWFNPTKGFGFIKPEAGGPDVFLHVSAIQKAGYTKLSPGDRLRYEVLTNRNGNASAENLQLLSKPDDPF